MYPKVLVAVMFGLFGFEPYQIKEFLAGMMFGFIKKDEFINIDNCLTDVKEIEHHLKEALNDFKAGGVENMLNGAIEMNKVIENFTNDVEDCKAIKDDIHRIKVWSQIFDNKKDLAKLIAKNFVKHNIRINLNKDKIIIHLIKHDMYAVGLDVSEILILLLGPV